MIFGQGKKTVIFKNLSKFFGKFKDFFVFSYFQNINLEFRFCFSFSNKTLRYLYRLELEGLVPDTDHVHAPDELELSTASTGTALSETDKQESSSADSEQLEVVKKDEIKKIADSDEGDIDDWEKDLDLDITEEEMNKALAEVDDDWDLEDA